MMNILKMQDNSALRRLKVLNTILSATDYLPPVCFQRRAYSSDKDAKFIRIGNSIREVKPSKSPEKIPTGYLSLYSGTMSDSQSYLKSLKWLMQKDQLKQDSFLIGSPPGAFRRNLAMSYAELTGREVEYLCLTRDTTEADIKQRREIVSSSVIYENQCAVDAALHGRILIIEGIEKAERNLLPILNNLLENRELNLDDGHFLVSPQRFDKLADLSNSSELRSLNLLRVHEDFRVIALGLPVPKYRGNSLDPPLRSRFQAHLVSMPTYEDYFKYLTQTNPTVDRDLVKNLCDFAYSFYTKEMEALNLLDFPVENIDKLIRIISQCTIVNSAIDEKKSLNYFNLTKLINKLYPYKFIIKEEDSKLYFDLLKKFNLPLPNSDQVNAIDYKLISTEAKSNEYKTVKFNIGGSENKQLQIDVISGTRPNDYPHFIMNDYHSSQLVDMMLSHSSGHDFCLVGSQGSGKTELIKKFASLLDYNMQTIYMFKDMTSRNLIQQRVTLPNGDTKWLNSAIVNGCLNGDLIVLDGIHRLRDDTIMALRRLVQDRELDLPDGRKLLRHDKYDELVKKDNSLRDRILRIHPAFRMIATAEAPQAKSSLKSDQTDPKANTSSNSQKSTEWLTPEVLNLFLFHHVESLSSKYEYEILSKKYKINEQHAKLFNLVNQLRERGDHDLQMKHIAKFFSLRNLDRLCKKLEKHSSLNLVELIENLTLKKFMPQLNKQLLGDFLKSVDPNLFVKLDETINFDLYNKYIKEETSEQPSSSDLKELSKIPDILFYENDLHKLILNNLIRDFDLGEHLLLIGNQGTGKNKLVDKFLMMMHKPREYIQLHRDTTVNSLTIQPVIKSGLVSYEDSPLVKAVKDGYILVVDEADKAPLNVICILKSLIESGEMILSDGRQIVNKKPSSSSEIQMHPSFRMIILANRPGFPFLGNDFFNILGDLLSCHPIDNPDAQSELAMLKMYAPSVSESVLKKLVGAFGSLRHLSDQGLISYPYSTRELVNIAKHLQQFPNDSLASVITNVSDFDHFAEQNDLRSTFVEIMHKHGIPIDTSTFRINLAAKLSLPNKIPFEKLKLSPLEFKSSSVHSIMNLTWSKLGQIDHATDRIKRFSCDQRAARIDSFSELRSGWSLGTSINQQLVNDFLVVSENQTDTIYVSGVKPLAAVQLNTKTNEAIELNLGDFFNSAWRSYYPRTKLFAINETNCVILFERTTNDLFKINFQTNEVFKLEKNLQEANSNAKHFLNKAKKSFNKFFVDQDQIYNMISLQNNQMLMNYKMNSNQLSLIDFAKNLEFNLDLDSLDFNNFKMRITNLTCLSPGKVLITAYDNSSMVNGADNLEARNLQYFVLHMSNDQFSLESCSKKFKLDLIDSALFPSQYDLLVNEIENKNMQNSNENLFFPTVNNHFVQIGNENDPECLYSPRAQPLSNTKNNYKIRATVPITKSIIDYANQQIFTQITKSARPGNLNLSSSSLGLVEMIDLKENQIRYFEVDSLSSSKSDSSSSYLNVINEAEFFIELSPTKQGNFYTLDFDGNISEWETSQMNLERSLDEWRKMIISNNGFDEKLNIEVIKESPNKMLRDFKGPKHGKVDPNNDPHVGGNTWAGGSGGFDTAGLGGVGGPYRLDSGNQVFQIDDALKQSVPEEVRKKAREMGEKAMRERLREIQMSEHEHNLYLRYLELVRKPIQQLRNILNSLEAKQKERQWLKNQTQGDLDDSKLVEAVTGEKNVYKRRGDDPNADNSLNLEKPKRLRLVVDVSGSMYRFNGVDNRLERELESVLMVMEAFDGFENKIKYDIIGHSGDGFNIKFVDCDNHPKNEAERLKLIKTLIAHSQFCSSGDYTFEATLYAIDELAKEEADDYFVIVLSDANFDRYGLSPRRYAQIMTRNDKVNCYCIFIGALGDQAIKLKNSLPSGKTFVCMNTQEIPRILQLIFQSAMLT